VAGAAIDVFAEEPYSGPLLAAPNVVVTPHLAASTDEAQDRAGLIVAEQVAAALRGELVTNAVNIPTVGADDLEVLGPFIPLAAKLGRLAAQLAGGDMHRMLVEAEGELADYDTRLLTVAALNGAFQGRTDQPVNYVNAPIIAADRAVPAASGCARPHGPVAPAARGRVDRRRLGRAPRIDLARRAAAAHPRDAGRPREAQLDSKKL